MQWDKVKGYHSLTDEIRKGIRRVLKNDCHRSVESWFHKILSILRIKDAFIK